ncbi:MAG: hypothetical protein NVSMB38_17270 [Ktedonobacteraceae bacterium]
MGFVFGIVLLAIGITLLILGAKRIITGDWLNIISFVVSVLGLLISALTWFFPFSSDSPLIPSEPEPDRGAELGVNKRRGAIVIYAKRSMRGRIVDLYKGFYRTDTRCTTSSIAEHIISKQKELIAEFPSLEPGDYTVSAGFWHYVRLTVTAGRVSKVDWR